MFPDSSEMEWSKQLKQRLAERIYELIISICLKHMHIIIN